MNEFSPVINTWFGSTVIARTSAGHCSRELDRLPMRRVQIGLPPGLDPILDPRRRQTAIRVEQRFQRR